jgi:uncharacterized protein (TIGR02996 family)
MDTGTALLAALHADPADQTAWLVLADWLEEQGEPERAELSRLALQLRDPTRSPARRGIEERVQALLAAGVAPCHPKLTNAAGLELALIPAGTFWMGSPANEPGRYEDEGRRAQVEISHPFYLGVTPVTQEQYERLTGSNPSHFRAGGAGEAEVEGLDTRRLPAEEIPWHAAVAFCAQLSALPEEKEAGHVYRLPTEAEWEYACRAGTTSMVHSGAALSSREANFDGNFPIGGATRGPYLGRTCPVGSFPPNAWGLFDLHGNVWEWCADWFDHDYPHRRPRLNPRGPERGDTRVLRGGSWFGYGRNCRSACRYMHPPHNATERFGFRVAMVVRQGE